MLKDAISKIQSEMDKATNNPYAQAVGGFLLQYLETNPGSAEKILTPDKTIAKSLTAMRSEAEKKKVGNCAVLTDAEGFAVVLKYFGIEGQVNTPAPAAPRPATAVPAPAAADFDVRLEDLL